MKIPLLICILITSALSADVLAQQASREDAASACQEAARLIEDEGDLVEALDEAQWCVESLQQLKQQQTLTLFPDMIDGYTGGELQNQSALGMTVIERTYKQNEHTVTVSLTDGIASGGLAALAQLGMSLGASGSGKKLRVQRRTVVNMSQPDLSSEYMVQLKSGGMLAIKSDTLNELDLLEFVREFPIADLDDALTQ